MRSRISRVWAAVAGVFLLASPLLGQLKIGDNLDLNANGTISAGYSGTYGNEIGSSHGLGFGGAAGLSGFYYNPNFLSFNVNPYYNQSRSNSTFGSVSDASGVTLSSAIFSGSHFPGSVNYTTSFNNTGNYGVPGIAGLNTNGDSQSFGIGWSALLPGLPTLTAGYQQGSENYSIYGSNQSGNSQLPFSFPEFELFDCRLQLGRRLRRRLRARADSRSAGGRQGDRCPIPTPRASPSL